MTYCLTANAAQDFIVKILVERQETEKDRGLMACVCLPFPQHFSLSLFPSLQCSPSSFLPLTYPPLLPGCLPWQQLTCWDRPLIYLERALKWRGQDEWHFNVLLRCLVTSAIDHSAVQHTPAPSLSHRPSRCPGGETWLSGRE